MPAGEHAPGSDRLVSLALEKARSMVDRFLLSSSRQGASEHSCRVKVVRVPFARPPASSPFSPNLLYVTRKCKTKDKDENETVK